MPGVGSRVTTRERAPLGVGEQISEQEKMFAGRAELFQSTGGVLKDRASESRDA